MNPEADPASEALFPPSGFPLAMGKRKDSGDIQRESVGHSSVGCFFTKQQQSFIQTNAVIHETNSIVYKHMTVSDINYSIFWSLYKVDFTVFKVPVNGEFGELPSWGCRQLPNAVHVCMLAHQNLHSHRQPKSSWIFLSKTHVLDYDACLLLQELPVFTHSEVNVLIWDLKNIGLDISRLLEWKRKRNPLRLTKPLFQK